MKPLLICLVAMLVLPWTAVNARAQSDLLFTLDSVIQSSAPGTEVIFTGTLTNTGAAPLFLNGIQFNFDSLSAPYLTGDANVFFNNTPISLAAAGTAGDTYAGPIFGVDIDPSTPLDTYSGSVTLTGGADDNATSLLATQNFEVVAQAAGVPEGDTLLDCCLGLGLAACVVLYSRRKASSQAGTV